MKIHLDKKKQNSQRVIKNEYKCRFIETLGDNFYKRQNIKQIISNKRKIFQQKQVNKLNLQTNRIKTQPSTEQTQKKLFFIHKNQISQRKQNNYIKRFPTQSIQTQFQSPIIKKCKSNINKIYQLNRLLKSNQQKIIYQPQQIYSPDPRNFNNSPTNYTTNYTTDQQNQYQTLNKIRNGCFGSVFVVRQIKTGRLLAVKKIKHDPKNKQRQQQICKMLGSPFVIKILKIFRTFELIPEQKESSQCQSPSIIHSQHILQPQVAYSPLYSSIHLTNILTPLYQCDLHDYIQMKSSIDQLTIKLFCYQMLRSLMYIHSKGIIHRDVKPRNFLVCRQKVILGDFGSSKVKGKNKQPSTAYIVSRFYRAPELILGYKYYDKPIDMWAVGCVMAEIALGRPLFQGSDSLDQLIKIFRVIGTPKWRTVSFMLDQIPQIPQIKGKGLSKCLPKKTSPKLINLLQKLLVANPLHRMTAGQALCHEYFDQIRDQLNYHQINQEIDISYYLTFTREQLKFNQHLKNKMIPAWFTQLNQIKSSKQ